MPAIRKAFPEPAMPVCAGCSGKDRMRELGVIVLDSGAFLHCWCCHRCGVVATIRHCLEP